jgi:hypothetical protein
MDYLNLIRTSPIAAIAVLCALLCSCSYNQVKVEGKKNIYEDIRREAVRPNGDPEGRALPLASRWTVHNWADKDVVGPGEKPGVHWPFLPERLMNDIDAGHHVMPFLNWTIAGEKLGGGYGVPWSLVEPAFRRMSDAGLPFEFECGNIEDAMFGEAAGKRTADRYWHRPMAENPAHIRADIQGKSAAAQTGAAEVPTSAWPTGSPKGARFVIFSGHGHVYTLKTPLEVSAQGAAVLKLTEPLTAPVREGELVAMVEPRMDFWSAADPAIWEEAGGDLVRETFNAKAETWQKMAEVYPNPPMVQLVSNNEGGGKVDVSAGKVSWHYQSQRERLEKEFTPIGKDPYIIRSDRLSYAKGYVEKMSAYLRGARKALPWPEGVVKCIAYNGFGVNFEVGRWGGWGGGAIPFKHVDMYPWLAWDGSAPDFYTYDWNYATDEHVGSPHIGSMQAYTMLAPRAEAQVPGYQWQLALWDGGPNKRYRYARWGELPRTREVGKTATAITASGALELPIEGAKPGELILEQGDFFSIEGHSEYQPALCTAQFDQVSLPGEGGGGIGLFATSADIGSVGLPGKTTFADGVYTVTGAGWGFANMQTEAKGEDSFQYLSRPLNGDGAVVARVKAVDNPDAGMRPTEAAYVPNTPGADYVDPAAAATHKEIAEKQSGAGSPAMAGVMLRASDAPDAPFIMLYQQPGGRVFIVSRRDKKWPTASQLVTDKHNTETKWLRIERKGDDCVPAYSTDGVAWTTLEPVKVMLGKEPLAGLAVTSRNWPQMRLGFYSAAADVRADADGKAVIPVGTLQGGPILINSHFKPIAQGVPVYFHNYLERYEGLCNTALWLSRPRIIREFAWGDFDGQVERQWQTLMRAVDRVWTDPVLTRFWRKGALVVNPDYEAATGVKHPFWELTDLDKGGRVGPWLELWKKQDRFYQLTVPVNPPFAKWPQGYLVAFKANPDDEHALIKVWAFAYELGTAPKREWLLYVQSPREDRKAVEVKVPGFGDVAVDVTRSGAFYHLQEGQKGASRVGLEPK